ncbi:hypothetical protein AX15_003066 [Amanita polypyramis BW_CC]|nr:hypothetical protein AX15_003066 [Amanita polypyramis BW_CC]
MLIYSKHINRSTSLFKAAAVLGGRCMGALRTVGPHRAVCCLVHTSSWDSFVKTCSLKILTSRSEHPREGVVRYYLMATTFYTIVWSARLSLLFSLIRVDPHAKRRKSLFFVASVYIGLYILLTGQLFWICAPQQTWKTAVVPQCPIGFPVAVLQLITDLLADGTLLIVPMFLFSIISDGSLRYRLMVIFSTCIITTVVSLVHTIYVLTTGGIKVEIAALVEDCVSLVVCNIPVISSALLRSREDKSRQPGTNLLSSIAFRSDGQDSDSLYVDIY